MDGLKTISQKNYSEDLYMGERCLLQSNFECLMNKSKIFAFINDKVIKKFRDIFSLKFIYLATINSFETHFIVLLVNRA